MNSSKKWKWPRISPECHHCSVQEQLFERRTQNWVSVTSPNWTRIFHLNSCDKRQRATQRPLSHSPSPPGRAHGGFFPAKDISVFFARLALAFLHAVKHKGETN